MAKFGDAVKEIRRMKEDNRSFPMVMPAIVQAFEDALAEINVLRSAFELYKAEATKKEKFLLDRMDQVMQTHAKLFEEKVQEIHKMIHSMAGTQNLTLQGVDALTDRVLDLERPGKDNNNMR